MSSKLSPLLRLLPLAAALTACLVAPPRFFDRAPVTRVDDMRPIPLPATRVDPIDVLLLSEAFVRRPALDVLAPGRIPRAGDVSSLDEVPTSSWFRGDVPAADADGPPVPPLRVLGAERTPCGDTVGLPVLDARGKRYELRRDSADRPRMRTAAAAIGSRLARAVGYRTPAVHLLDVSPDDLVVIPTARTPESIGDPGVLVGPLLVEHADRAKARFLEAPLPVGEARLRVAATRWPVGIDVGRTIDTGLRDDDPNDEIAHEDRRTLRGLRVLAGWLGLTRFGAHSLRDVYVGEPGKGHLQHALVRFDGALGADAVVDRRPEQRDEGLLLLSFGLAPDPEVEPTQRRFLSIGQLEGRVLLDQVRTPLPFVPIERAQPADLYWMAKRIGAVSIQVIDAAVREGRLDDPGAASWLVRTLDLRRRHLLEQIYAKVTPVEFRGVKNLSLLLCDLLVFSGFASASAVDLSLSLHTRTGERLGLPRSARPDATGHFEVHLPELEHHAREDLLLRVQQLRAGSATPPMVLHLRYDAEWGLRITGITR